MNKPDRPNECIYDAAFKNLESVKKITNQYRLIPDIFDNMDDALILIASLINENSNDIIIHLISLPQFDVTHNNHEYIKMITDQNTPSFTLRNFDLLSKSFELPCIYKKLSNDFIEDMIYQFSPTYNDQRILNLFNFLKIKNKFQGF